MLRVSGPTATVALGSGPTEVRIVPRLRGGPPVAGDLVRLRHSGDDIALAEIEPRATVLERATGRARRPRAIIANADLIVIVSSVVDPPLDARVIDRYLVAGELGGLDCALAITKVDLPHDRDALEGVVARYESLGYPVLCGSALEPELPRALEALIDDRLAALVGHSGVGKSTLASVLTGVERARSAVSGKSGTGRHTTTDPRLIRLRVRGAIVDTAGVRTFHLPRLTPLRLAQGFPEIAAAAERCRFGDCRHLGEEGCAVASAVGRERLESYRALLAEQEAVRTKRP